jgi:hypothetical protein
MSALVTVGRYYDKHLQYMHMPLLVQFGGLSPRDVILHNEDAFDVAVGVAKRNIQRCVVGNTEDMHASARLLQWYLPWLADAMAPENLPRLQVTANFTAVAGGSSTGTGSHSSHGSSRPPLSNETAALIRNYYRAEVEVYEFALELHRRQVQEVAGAS